MTGNVLKFDACPRCKVSNVIEYDDLIECNSCNLEFEKEEIRKADDLSEVLSIQEKKGIFNALFG